MAALTAVSAYVILPIGPVPITMQTCFVLALWRGARQPLGAPEARSSTFCLGLAGIPVFAGGMSGLPVS